MLVKTTHGTPVQTQPDSVVLFPLAREGLSSGPILASQLMMGIRLVCASRFYPPPSLRLQHDFVAQPHLSHSLTLRLLQINRNPDLLTVPQMPSSAAAAASRLAAPVTAPDTPVNRRPLASAQARAPQSRGIVGVGAAASSSRAANRPIPPNAAAPSSNGGVSGPVARSAHDDVDIKVCEGIHIYIYNYCLHYCVPSRLWCTGV